MKAIKLRDIHIDEDLLNQLVELPHMFVAKNDKGYVSRAKVSFS